MKVLDLSCLSVLGTSEGGRFIMGMLIGIEVPCAGRSQPSMQIRQRMQEIDIAPSSC